jgi:starvation-inducible DNA-binding protein
MKELESSLNICLGNTFVMYFQAHSYHWNVEGINFPQYHQFFGDLYEELYSAIDPIAEEIRALDVYAPISLTQLYKYATIEEDTIMPGSVIVKLQKLLDSNQIVIDSLNKAFQLANDANKQGLVDFIAGRIDIHNKHGWMLRASLKGL